MSDREQPLPDAEYLAVLGRRIRSARRTHELSQRQVADMAGLSRNFVSGLERGCHSIDLLTLRRLARALGTEVEALIRGIDRDERTGTGNNDRSCKPRS
jgi:transcriptional regulator with XRE-family HTH domain